MTNLMQDITLLAPEIFLGGAALFLLLLGAFWGNRGTRVITVLSILVLLVTAIEIMSEAVLWTRTLAFGGMFITDVFAVTMKSIVLLGLAAALMIAISPLHQDLMERFEYPVLVLLAGVGMMTMISAHHFLTLYIGIELSALALYILAAFRRETVISAEAGMKYFILGALSSGMLLFGISLLYGFTGSLAFDQVHLAAAGTNNPAIMGVTIGMVFVLAGMAFKISAVPFHMWTPDVYQGAPGPVTALFAMVPKIAAVALLIRLLFEAFMPLAADWQPIIMIMAAASMVWGAFAAIRQSNIKRLLAYASIGNVGFALLGLLTVSTAGIAATILYMTVYLVMTAGVFAVFLTLRRNGVQVEEIDDLAGLSRTHPLLAYALAAMLFSMAGIPPLAGFFSKLVVFQVLVADGQVALAILGLVASVVAAYYYLKLIRVMFFGNPEETLEARLDGGQQLVLLISILFVVVFALVPQEMYDLTLVAAKTFAVP